MNSIFFYVTITLSMLQSTYNNSIDKLNTLQCIVNKHISDKYNFKSKRLSSVYAYGMFKNFIEMKEYDTYRVYLLDHNNHIANEYIGNNVPKEKYANLNSFDFKFVESISGLFFSREDKNTNDVVADGVIEIWSVSDSIACQRLYLGLNSRLKLIYTSVPAYIIKNNKEIIIVRTRSVIFRDYVFSLYNDIHECF